MCVGGHRLSSVQRLLMWTGVAITTAGVLAGCAGGLLPSGATVPALSLPPHAHTNGAEVAIGVLREGWHTGLIIPAAEIGPSLAGLHEWFPQAKYLVFGWGNRAFYTATHSGLGMALSALLPSSSVVFVRGLPDAPEKTLAPGAELRWVCASPSRGSKLDAYLGDYLQKGRDGRLISVGPGPLPGSWFFVSPGTYDAFHTCNTWTAAGLEFAGLPVSAGGIVFAGQVMSEIRALRSCHKQTATAVSPFADEQSFELAGRPPQPLWRATPPAVPECC